MLCKNCGTECPDGYNVCTNCGASLDASVPVETPEVFNVEEPVSKKDKTAKTLGIVSVVLAVISFILHFICCLGWLTSLAGIICGVVSCVMGTNKKNGIVGIVANIAALLFALIIGFIIGLLSTL